MPDALSMIPEITDEDIEWVRTLMGLNAIDHPRREFLVSRSTLDVSACPGSGKTTLIVAKLAILARKWPHRTKGICVLSHTNVAREEIQRRLGDTAFGQRLLNYPHFINTIHSFVNRFLALPWLNSNGYPSPTIDDAVTTAHRRGVLAPREYQGLKFFLEKNHSSFDWLRICGRDMSFDLGGKPFPAGQNTNSYQFAKRAIEASAQGGYFCYNEMFVWARALLEDYPDVASWLAHRFPLVIIDEMQDTSEYQGGILHTVFPRRSPEHVVQRVGDPNQTIFDFDSPEPEPENNDPYPDPNPAYRLAIPNSYRFGPKIAALASPFAFAPVSDDGLCGVGPKDRCETSVESPHAVFIFPDDCTEGVLDAYGSHVLSVLDNSTLTQGPVTAVGGVHRAEPDVLPGHAHFPKTVPHYWNGYSAETSKKNPHPNTLANYIRMAQAAAWDSHEFSKGVEIVASGLIRLAGSIGNVGHIKRKTRTHHSITEVLTSNTESLKRYRLIINEYLLNYKRITEEKWQDLRENFLTVACALCDGSTEASRANSFLSWSGEDTSLTNEPSDLSKTPGPNIYRVIEGERQVDIRVGSIHSVKGQSHIATMILNTYWNRHSSNKILPWLLGTRCNGQDVSQTDKKRLLQIYVAMTRPSHLVCLTIRRSALGNTQEYDRNVATLSGRGWRVAEIVGGVTKWRE